MVLALTHDCNKCGVDFTKKNKHHELLGVIKDVRLGYMIAAICLKCSKSYAFLIINNAHHIEVFKKEMGLFLYTYFNT